MVLKVSDASEERFGSPLFFLTSSLCQHMCYRRFKQNNQISEQVTHPDTRSTSLIQAVVAHALLLQVPAHIQPVP